MNMKTHIGIKKEHLTALDKLLNGLLADELVLAAKTKKFHWNVTGPHFTALHQLFDLQHTELLPQIDTLAERIRALGLKSIGGMKEAAKLSGLKDSEGDPDYKTMLSELLSDHETVIRTIRSALPTVGDKYGDAFSESVLTAMLEWHEKTAWMLRSHLE
jgi:starvation-inducible DNA-binding protein